MKILFLSHYYHPHIGGVERHVKRLSHELAKDGNEVVIITSKHKKGLKDFERVEGTIVFRVDLKNIRAIGLFWIWIELIKRLKLFLKSDIVHVHDVFIWYLPVRIFLFWKPVVVTHHGWEGEFPIPHKNILLKRMASLLSNDVIVVGKFINKFYGTSSKKIIYGGIDPPTKRIKKSRKIVYVGRLARDTGLPILLRTLKYFKSYHVEFLGDGELKNECKRYGKTYGFVRNPERYVADAQICFCSGYLSILEALANKCFVVTAYDNPLKKSYFLDTPFKKWIATGNRPGSIYNSFKKLNQETTKAGCDWALNQSWKSLAKLHQKIYTDLI